MAMAAGEWVSVSSQRDVEDADRAREAIEQQLHPEAERLELVGIYESRGCRGRSPSRWLTRCTRPIR